MKLKKMVSVGLAALMSVSTMSMTAFAKEAIYDNDGVLIGYEYTTEDLEDSEKGKDLLGQIPSICSYGSSTPGYNSSLWDLTIGDYVDTFSLYSYDSKYSKLWSGASSNVGFRFYDVDDMRNITAKVYRVSSNGSATQVFSYVPSVYNSIGFRVVSLSDSNRYYVMLTNKITENVSGSLVITNNPSNYGMN